MADTTGTVCVTGANGFLATHIVAQLLEAGYSVRGTVRPSSLKNEKKVGHLKDLPGASERLELVPAELLDSGAFDSAVEGCVCVMHTASPYVLNVEDAQKDLVEPAVEGTLNVLRSCVAANIPRIVLTSSMAAVTDSPKNNHVYTEADWNDESSLKRNPYYFSKTEAEKAAWAYIKEQPDDCVSSLVVANPFAIVGPEPSGGCNTSNGMLQGLFIGTFPGVMDLNWGLVDVRDVAKAHILLMKPEAEGRHLIMNASIPMKDVIKLYAEHFPGYKFPTANLACTVGSGVVKLASYFGKDKGTGQYLRTNIGKEIDCNTSKIQALGLEYRALEETLLETAEDMIKRDHIPPPPTS